MKSEFKIVSIPLMLLALAFTFSCSNNAKDSKDMAEDQNQEKFDTHNAEKNAQLLVDLVSGQYYEIHLSRYAMQKSTSSEVKDLAGMMVTDHTAFLTQLKALASQKSVSVPNEDSTDINNKMNDWKDKKPMDFDKAWTNEMIDKHKSAIDKMQNAVNDNDTDADVKALLNNTIPTVRTHLDKLNQCKDNIDKMKY